MATKARIEKVLRWHYDGCSPDEIADITHLPEGECRDIIRRYTGFQPGDGPPVAEDVPLF
ncbi:hypothetical protein PG2006B_1108 [Bifidobacterium animalis subsp. animalis]|uniref:hypothetical protein n=1 Tax=Bifidobacterium animalis TaxID=28025 RepID=UPI00102032A6|nr:hypothetical protein [Bifidobacterium animalis]RYN12642.1 hypothetical protein PG2006B_1108 [Bifidobacterium animalis subsp. animalis]